MPNDVLQQAIMEAYASSPSDVLIYHTLEIKHPDFIDDNGNPITIFLVQGFHNITAKLETGKNVEFQAMCFNIELPPVDTSSQHRTELIYRPYLSTDLTTPQMIPPVRLTVTEISGDVYKITAKARMTDIGNKTFPNETYRLSKFMGLVS